MQEPSFSAQAGPARREGHFLRTGHVAASSPCHKTSALQLRGDILFRAPAVPRPSEQLHATGAPQAEPASGQGSESPKTPGYAPST